MAGAILGTPTYMSPEQCRGLQADVDQRADIYSLGIILYELVCGRPPFVGPAPGEVMMMHMSAEPLAPSRLRPGLPARFERVVLQAIAKRREDRFSSMTEFMSALGPSDAAPEVVSPSGHLSLDSAPWSNVYLGERLLGSTPLIRLPLPPGKHVLTLKNPELGASMSYVVEIKSGAAVSRFVGWEKE